MNDAENLSKLLGHLPPAVFREFMVDEFGLAMPDLDAKKPKQRSSVNRWRLCCRLLG
jgi:hypothetical protein